MSTSPLPPTTTTPPGPSPIGITLNQAALLKGWIALDGKSQIVGHAPTEADLRAALGHHEDVVFFALHLFEEPLPEERTGTRILHGYFELKEARLAFIEDPWAATAQLSGRLRVLLAGIAEISAQPDMGRCAPVWALAYWTTRTESQVLADLRSLQDRRLIDYRTGKSAEAWMTPFGRQVARLVNAWRHV